MLTERELNRALLARQLLLKRVKLSIPRALERICGIQNQYAPSAYIRLWSCLERFERDDLTRALERRTAVQATLMRNTIHIVSRRDYALFAAAIRGSMQEWWRRVNKQPNFDFAPVAEEVRGFLRGRTATLKELNGLLRNAQGVDVVRVPPAGTWENRRAHTFALAEDWVGSLEVDEDEAMEHLVRRYIAGFGPATRDDIAKFTSITRPRVQRVLDRLDLRRFRDEAGRELVDLPRAPLPDPETPAPPRFIPWWDSMLLVHARRAGILEEEYRKRIFHVKAPQSFPTFLVDGRVAGTWKYEDGRVKLEPFERIPRAVRAELDDEAGRLATLHR